jgi:radical SAM protein with 4Fe4S-binding SPASM domain
VCEKLIDVPEMTAGNVRNNTLEEIWNAQKIQDILNPNIDVVKQPCRDCELLDTCHTGCFAASMFVSESPYDVDPRCWKANLANNPYTKVVDERMQLCQRIT